MICYPTVDSPSVARKRVSLRMLRDMHACGEPIAMVTAYEALFAQVLDDAGADCLLVSDSLGMLVQGHGSTLPVTLEQMVYHTGCVARGNQHAWIIADLPWASMADNPIQLARNAAALIQAGAQMVKLTGGHVTADIVSALTRKNIPVCAHLGLTARSVHALGGARPQSIDDNTAATLLVRAMELAEAGAAMLVLEHVPASLATKIKQALPQLLTVGIQAGPDVSGQLLCMHDVLGLTGAKLPRQVRNLIGRSTTVEGTVRAFITAVKERSFPEEVRASSKGSRSRAPVAELAVSAATC